MTPQERYQPVIDALTEDQKKQLLEFPSDGWPIAKLWTHLSQRFVVPAVPRGYKLTRLGKEVRACLAESKNE